jgi:hypothetical protein
MRQGFGFVIATMLIACSSTTIPGTPSSDQPDAPVGDSNGGGGGSDGGPADAAIIVEPPTFTVVSPTIDVPAKSDSTYCYYFHMPNTANVSIKKWASHLTDGATQLTLFLTETDKGPDDTMLKSPCGMKTNGDSVVWSYSADTADAEMVLPADDGTGQPVGMSVRAGQPAILQIHVVNPADHSISAHVELAGYTHPDGAAVTLAAPYVTYNLGIDLPATPKKETPTTGNVSGNCNVDPAAKFFSVSAHTFKQATHTFVKDKDTMVFDNVNWQNPDPTSWDTAPFFSFASQKMSYQCEYANPNGYRIQTGDDAAINEMCVTVGYYFPAEDSTGHFCVGSTFVR